MAKKVPKNNRDPVLVDVKRPDLNYEHSAEFDTVDLNNFFEKGAYDDGFRWGSFFFKSILGFVSVAFVIFSVLFVLNIKDARVLVEERSGSLVENFSTSLEAVKNLEPKKARKSLKENQESLKEIQRSLGYGSSRFAFELASGVVPLFKKAGGLVKGVASLNLDMMKVAQSLSVLKTKGFGYFMEDGEKLVAELRKLDSLLKGIRKKVNKLNDQASYIDEFSSLGGLGDFSGKLEKYNMKYVGDLYVLEGFLDGVLDLVGSSEKKRILLMFQNSSEIRPAGGFLGSYGELVIKNGEMKNIKVEDIYWPDHEKNFDLKLIPPKPLQRITEDLGARDGNWFFDFPTSAETVMRLLESSKIYEKKDIEFEGAIGIDVGFLGTLLEYTGPMKVKEYDMTINSDNYLGKLQKEVETGKDKQAGKNPKKILSVIAPRLIEELKGMGEKKFTKLMEDVSSHIEKKDIMFYSRDSRIADVLNKWKVDGSVFDIPDDFWGTYLSVVNANVGGAKSDAYTNQSVEVWVDVGSGGGALVDTSITRTNNGDKKKASWYNTTNRNFLKVLSNPGSSLVFVKGQDSREPVRRTYGPTYKHFGKFKDLAESRVALPSFDSWKVKQSGKTGFGTWSLIPPGEKETVDMRIENPSKRSFAINEDKKYKFVFDKQAGVDTELEVNISAPVGYVWEKTGSPSFTFKSDDLRKRVVIELTPKKIR